MVRAILAGRKKQTRPIITPQPLNRPILAVPGLTIGADRARDGAEWIDADGIDPGVPMKAPYKPGDVLRVRESFMVTATESRVQGVSGVYLADGRAFSRALTREQWAKFRRWKPKKGGIAAMYMFASLSRLWLDVVSVRAERVQAISDRDALAEGVAYDVSAPGGSPMDRFRVLWDAINARRAPWRLNPWVWVIEFQPRRQADE
jgi:hypothetical protein